MAVKSRRAEHVQDTRGALVEAARELFAEKGYAGTGTEEIVARARVTRGALYHHFGDKAGLFRAVMAMVAAELAQGLVAQEISHEPGDATGAWGQLREGVQAFLDACADSDFQRIVLIEGPAVLGPGAWSELVEEHGLGLLRTWLQRAIDDHQIDPLPVEPLARLLAALIGDASMYIGQAGDPTRARQETGLTIDRILSGLRSGAGG
ncbi:MAG: TetR/AcrR family transcriptional regulator [Nocardiopsaceae bacterium]|jgi:AcrR family transcriptional regulator|nr:TetR/AcrR family transcriptional regulator [Nocardiopsaceae bacterium]